MISARTMVHLPDTTYGGTPIDWNYADNSKNELQQLRADNAKLRELVADMWHEGMCECGSRGKCASCEYDYPTRMRELGIEVDR